MHITLGIPLTVLATFAMSQTIDPSSVPIATRESWCSSQTAQCPLICLQTAGNSMTTEENTCDPTTLYYSCVCSNGLSPNASEYSLTIPYFECTQYNSDCVSNCGGVSTCQGACVQDHPCGAQNPTRVNTTAAKTMTLTGAPTSSAASTVIYTGFGVAATSTAAAAAGNGAHSTHIPLIIRIGELWGLGALTAVVAGGLVLLS